MLMLDRDRPVTLDVIDADHNRISAAQAILKHLDGETAILELSSSQLPAGLYWGARVRFWLNDGLRGYEATGAVFICPPKPLPGDPLAEGRDVHIRLHECVSRRQRRECRRADVRVPVTFTFILEQGEQAPPHDGELVDIGTGGLRMRSRASLPTATPLSLEFSLPTPEPQRVQIEGRILRSTPCREASGIYELAVKFHRITPSQGAELAAFLESTQE